MPKNTLGKLPREAIRLLELPRIAPKPSMASANWLT